MKVCSKSNIKTIGDYIMKEKPPDDYFRSSRV